MKWQIQNEISSHTYTIMLSKCVNLNFLKMFCKVTEKFCSFFFQKETLFFLNGIFSNLLSHLQSFPFWIKKSCTYKNAIEIAYVQFVSMPKLVYRRLIFCQCKPLKCLIVLGGQQYIQSDLSEILRNYFKAQYKH